MVFIVLGLAVALASASDTTPANRDCQRSDLDGSGSMPAVRTSTHQGLVNCVDKYVGGAKQRKRHSISFAIRARAYPSFGCVLISTECAAKATRCFYQQGHTILVGDTCSLQSKKHPISCQGCFRRLMYQYIAVSTHHPANLVAL